MNYEAITKILEAVYYAAEDVGAGDQAACAFFDFACMITFFKVGDEARQYIEKDVQFLASEMDSRKDKAAQA